MNGRDNRPSPNCWPALNETKKMRTSGIWYGKTDEKIFEMNKKKLLSALAALKFLRLLCRISCCCWMQTLDPRLELVAVENFECPPVDERNKNKTEWWLFGCLRAAAAPHITTTAQCTQDKWHIYRCDFICRRHAYRRHNPSNRTTVHYCLTWSMEHMNRPKKNTRNEQRQSDSESASAKRATKRWNEKSGGHQNDKHTRKHGISTEVGEAYHTDTHTHRACVISCNPLFHLTDESILIDCSMFMSLSGLAHELPTPACCSLCDCHTQRVSDRVCPSVTVALCAFVQLTEWHGRFSRYHFRLRGTFDATVNSLLLSIYCFFGANLHHSLTDWCNDNFFSRNARQHSVTSPSLSQPGNDAPTTTKMLSYSKQFQFRHDTLLAMHFSSLFFFFFFLLASLFHMFTGCCEKSKHATQQWFSAEVKE